MIKFLILIIVISLSAHYPAILFLAIFYFAYRFLMKKKKRKTGIASFTDMVRKRRAPFAKRQSFLALTSYLKWVY